MPERDFLFFRHAGTKFLIFPTSKLEISLFPDMRIAESISVWLCRGLAVSTGTA